MKVKNNILFLRIVHLCRIAEEIVYKPHKCGHKGRNVVRNNIVKLISRELDWQRRQTMIVYCHYQILLLTVLFETTKSLLYL